MDELLNFNATTREEKWYQYWKFPLLPIIEKSKGDDYNTSTFVFTWLFFTFWTLDTIQFELSIVCSLHWGIGIIGMFPYLRWGICMPLPHSFCKIGRFFQRKPLALKNREKQNDNSKN